VTETVIPQYMTVEQVAQRLGVHEQQVYALARSGRLPSRRVGRFWRFDPTEVLEWIDSGKAAL
jgi:excisionase family DNA binding protein